MGEEEADRLVFLGRSSAALAHEVSNPLTAALLALDQLERASGLDGSSDGSALEELRASLEHVRDIVREVVRYAKEPRPLEAVCLADVASAARLLSRGPARGRATFEADIDVVPSVRGHRTRLVQAAVNLVANALSAVEGVADPCVRLTTSDDPVGRRVGLHVDDNGPGVPDTVAARLFEPFVSGRPDGAGLGLWISQRIADDHGGLLEHARSDSGWTRFSLWIPHASY